MLGYPYSKALLENASIDFVKDKSDSSNIKKLLSKRVDAVIMERTSGLNVIAELSVENRVQYDDRYPISEMNDYFAFHKSTEGRKLAEAFSSALERMKRNGVYHKFYWKINLE